MLAMDSFPVQELSNASARFSFPVLLVVVALLLPALAHGHAGEVHTDEPAPAVAKRDGDRGGGKPKVDRREVEAIAVPDGKDGSEQVSVTQTASEAPPVPEVPESNPAVHFLILGIVAILGAGLILLRRRRALG